MTADEKLVAEAIRNQLGIDPENVTEEMDIEYTIVEVDGEQPRCCVWRVI